MRQDYVLKKLDFDKKETEHHGHKEMTLLEVCPQEPPPDYPEWMPDLLDLKLDKMAILCRRDHKIQVWLYNDYFVVFHPTKKPDVVVSCRRRYGDGFDGKMGEIRLPRKLKECGRVVTSQDVAVAMNNYGWNEGLKFTIFRLAGDASEIVQVTRPDGQPLELVEYGARLDFYEYEGSWVNTYLWT